MNNDFNNQPVINPNQPQLAVEPEVNKTPFLKKYKKVLIISIICLILVIGGVVLYITLGNKELSWDQGLNITEGKLLLNHYVDVDSDEDLDYDGLTNKEEKEHGTNPEMADTDFDGLDDYYEIFNSKTDPLKEDTDGDGLNDYDEIELNLNPLKADSNDDGINDYKRKVSYTVTNDEGVILTINGTGNIPSTTITTYVSSTFEKKTGTLGTVYNFYTAGNLESAQVTISYSTTDLDKKDINETELSLYYFNEDTKTLEKVDSIVNVDKKEITAQLTHFSKYVLGDNSVGNNTKDSKITLLIDNSRSLQTEEQLKALGLTTKGALGTDADYKRISLANQIVDKINDGNYLVVDFSTVVYPMFTSFTNNKEEVKKAINEMKSFPMGNSNGSTFIASALKQEIMVSSYYPNSEKYILLFTDGIETNSSGRGLKDTIEDLIQDALSYNIKVCTIGLGDNFDNEYLVRISKETGCDYYSANDHQKLDKIVSFIESNGDENEYDLVDVDDDNKIDGTLIADSGFSVKKDGFSFKNYGSYLSPQGHCFGMASFVEYYYSKKLPLKVSSRTHKTVIRVGKTEEITADAYDLTNTYFDSNNNLYDFKFTSKALQYQFDENFKSNLPRDYYTIRAKTFTYHRKYSDAIDKTGIYSYITAEPPCKGESQLKCYGGYVDNLKYALIDEHKIYNSNVLDNSEKQLLLAIYSSFIKQDVTNYYSSGYNFERWFRNIYMGESAKTLGTNEFINALANRLNNKEAPLLVIDIGGNHAVNAISLIQDNKDSNKYYIGVYDNVYPGEKRYIDFVCNKKNCKAEPNDYYKNISGYILMTISIEDGLKYYKD